VQQLTDQTAIVTGAGHPKGIGRASALALAKQGANVAVTDLASTREGLECAVEEIRGYGVQAIAIPVDVTDRAQIDPSIATVLAEFGQIDILVNNAGVGVGASNFLDVSEEDWNLTLAVNVMGLVRFTQAVLPGMRDRRSGSIINVASLSGLRNIPPTPPCYTASKFAVIGLTKAVAQEFGPFKIRCNAVCPGSVDTRMRNDMMTLIAEASGISREEADAEERASISLGRPAQAEEIAAVVAFLAGPLAAYLTGAAIPVDGGMTVGL